MLSITRLSGANLSYYGSLASTDYYGVPSGRWSGAGAKSLGLVGRVEARDLISLVRGWSPTGEKLVQNSGSKSRCPGHDLTFSAPKSVSVVWALADDDLRAKIEACHDRAVLAALKALEKNFSVTRRGHGGHVHESCGLVAALFRHGASRMLDPQLHDHVLVLNVAQRTDGSFGTVSSRQFYRAKMALGALYRLDLAHGLKTEANLSLEPSRLGFEVSGVPKKAMRQFSKRREQIEEELRVRGTEGAAASEAAALSTRSRKQEPDPAALRRMWHEEAAAMGYRPEHVHRKSPQARTSHSRDMWLADALRAATEGKSTFTETDLLRAICESGIHLEGASSQSALELLDQALGHSLEVVRLGSLGGVQRFTTKANLELEREALALATSQPAKYVVPKPGSCAGAGLNDEQAQALDGLLKSHGRVFAISGLAGTGKTTLLRAANQEYSRAGFHVTGAAVTGKAADGLELGSGIPSTTVASLLLRERSTRPSLKKGSVLVIDEASMVSTSQMVELLRLVNDRDAKCVLVGDAAQLPPIGSGCLFALIAEATGAPRLGEIVRQRDPDFRNAVKAASLGLSDQVLAFLESSGSVSVEPTVAAAKSRLVRDWFAAHGNDPKQGLILSATNAAVLNLNLLAQHERRLAGHLWGEEVPLSGSSLYSGDRVLFTRNDRHLGVRNGNLGTVLETGGRLQVVLDDGRVALVPKSYHEHLRLGYAVTTHKAQGMTVDCAYVLADQRTINRESTYVSLSRARERAFVYADRRSAGDKLSRLSQAMSKSVRQPLALEVEGEEQRAARHQAL